MEGIVFGDRVRSYDFPGVREDSFVEGVVIGFVRYDNGIDRAVIHVEKDFYEGLHPYHPERTVCPRLMVHARLDASPKVIP